MKKSAIFTTTALIIIGLMGMSGCNTMSEQDRGEIAKAALLYAQTEPARKPDRKDFFQTEAMNRTARFLS